MRVCGVRLVWAAFGVIGIGLAMVGCNRQQPKVEKAGEEPARVEGSTGSSKPPEKDGLDALLHQSFAEATHQMVPRDHLLQDSTMTGKSVGKLYTEVRTSWDSIKFQTPGGKFLSYRALLDTDQGPIEIVLRPDLAPNHVRNFVALAKAGYYDGLVFERTVHEEIEGQPGTRLDLIEGGCPMGTGEMGYGSIGYWMKPEFKTSVSHEEGIIGASHGEEPDSAACKFYICLCKAPYMEGNFTVFGKVSDDGLSTAKKIINLPIRTDIEFPEGDRPLKPVVIRKVTIQTKESDTLGPN